MDVDMDYVELFKLPMSAVGSGSPPGLSGPDAGGRLK